MKTSATTVAEYNLLQEKKVQDICVLLESEIQNCLKGSESKIWHGSPVWFLEGNPIVAYSVRKSGEVSLMFFSGQSFEEADLKPEGKFKAAEVLYREVKEIKVTHLRSWLKKAKTIQWDYKNIVKNKGLLEKINISIKSEKICSRGHLFIRSKDVPTCPVCWPGRYKSNKK